MIEGGLTGSPFRAGRTLRLAWQSFRGDAPTILLLALAFHLPLAGLFVLDPEIWQYFGDEEVLVGDQDPLYGFMVIALAALTAVPIVTRVVRRLGGPEVPGALGRHMLAVCVPVILVALIRLLVSILGLVLLVVPGVLFLLASWVVLPVAILERPGIFSSFERSAKLTKGCRRQIFGVLAVVLCADAGLTVLAIVVFIYGQGLFLYFVADTLHVILSAILWAVVGAVSYVELRRVKEGLDTERVAAVFD